MRYLDRSQPMAGYLSGRDLAMREQNAGLSQMQGILAIQGALENQQMAPLRRQMLEAQVAQLTQKDEIPGLIGGILSGSQSGQPTGMPPNFPAAEFAALVARDPARAKAMLDVWKAQNPDLKYEGGIALDPRTGQPRAGALTIPHTNQQGFSTTPKIGPDGQISIGITPGAVEAYGTQQQIGEAAKAGLDLVQVPQSDGSTRMMPRSQAAAMLGGGQPTPQPAPQPAAPEFRIPPQVQAQRDVDASRIIAREGQPNGGGAIPTNRVVGNWPTMPPSPTQARPLPGGPSATPVLGTAQSPGAAEAVKATAKNDAELVNNFRTKTGALNNTLRRLDRMEALTADDATFAAAGAEIKSNLSSIGQALGLPVQKAKTANTEEYIAHVAELLKDRLASKDFGSGNGISNLDLLAAGRPLPDVMKTPQGRMQIISALRKDAEMAINDMSAARSYFEKNLSLNGFRYPSEIDAQIKRQTPGGQAKNNSKIVDFGSLK